jgi:hypothetical protein
MFFPQSRIGLEEISRRAIALDGEVERLARERGMHVVRHRGDWYGFDPIHLRLSLRRRAWREILRGWDADGRTIKRAGLGAARTAYLRTRVPEWRRLFGFEQRGRKPTARFGAGTTVTLY